MCSVLPTAAILKWLDMVNNHNLAQVQEEAICQEQHRQHPLVVPLLVLQCKVILVNKLDLFRQIHMVAVSMVEVSMVVASVRVPSHFLHRSVHLISTTDTTHQVMLVDPPRQIHMHNRRGQEVAM
jgi:hypothetical protein